MATKKYAFYFNEYARQSPEYEFTEIDDLYDGDDYTDIFVISIDDNTYVSNYHTYLYGCNSFGEYYLQWLKSDSSLLNSTNLCLEVHSHVNNHSLYEYNGPDRDGKYGDPVEIKHKEVLKISKNSDDVGYPAICMTFDNDANIVYTLSINPSDWRR